MSNTILISLLSVIVVNIIIFAWFYLFNIYEVKISVNPKLLNINLDSKIEVKAIPLNSFGTKALLRNISSKFKIISGEDLIRIKQQTECSIVVSSKGKVGRAEIFVTPSIGMFPSKIEINIE